MSRRLIAEVVSPVSGPLNPAYVSFSFADSVITNDALAANIIQYLFSVAAFSMENSCYIAGIEVQALPGGPLFNIPWPTAERATWEAYAPVGAGANYNNAMPTTAALQLSSGRGDSICVNTKTASGTSGGKGRHFLPYLTRNAVGSLGLIDTGYANNIEDYYALCFLGVGTGGPPSFSAADPVVYSVAETAEYAVVNASVNIIPSRLRSRTK